ncbi:MAG: acetyl-CoA decarbonylase/synthase complex subunit alpha/beta [Planctomycetota bacterium]|nr:acetyl-CoA decarbonylase/synthase complex subunit alpha/beta [Planctomycetota bacterium]MDI6787393.1 acetyl-CoA decarbonylase/synthase complex subunit alpha/beta [Planctomycetota bacterium]
MSKLIATRVIRGANKLVARAEKSLNEALQKYGPDKKVEFPNTAYFLPISYGMLGMKITTVGELQQLLGKAKSLLHPVPAEKVWLPYLGHTLDCGMATLFADEIIEALKYLQSPLPYMVMENCPEEGNFWLGAADDVIMRKRGVEFVDGTAPGFAACVGACPSTEIAVKIARELQEKSIYVFMSAANNGTSMADQLREAGVQMGWETRLVPLGSDVTATIHALGFATRAALAFGGVKPGDFSRVLKYNKNRVFAFALAFGEVDDEKHAQAAGAINFGFPAISERDIDRILPTGVCTYEHVVSPVPVNEIVQKAIEVRGLKLHVHKIPIPVSYGPAFEGERIRGEDTYLEMGGTKTPAFEFVTTKNINEITDNKIEVIGQEITDIPAGTQIPLGIVVAVAGRQMQEDFEPVLERRLHNFLNEPQGVFHMGQRDNNWMRISKEAKEKGFKLSHLGTIIHAQFHNEFGAIVDKVQVKIYTKEADVLKNREVARQSYRKRDERIGSMTDESTETFYSCTLCQSFAPTHVCVISPERTGLCGSYNWFTCKAAYQINPRGPNQPVLKNEVVDAARGQWKGCNDFVYQASRKAIAAMSFYSIMSEPMTSCGCFECIAAVLPAANGVMTVNREFSGMTPAGMKFSTLAGTIGGGQQIPGFVGHSKRYIISKKFLLSESGLKRLVWMPKMLKDEIKELFNKRTTEEGMPNLLDMIADETVATTEEEVIAHLQKTGHPALTLAPIMG